MSEFVLTGSDVFGRYCLIEQLRFYAPNEMYIYKVIKSLRSNCWCDVPYKTASKEVLHDSIEDCVLVICCGVDETEVLRFRTADVEFVPEPVCDRDALLKLADDMDAYTECDDERCGKEMPPSVIHDYARRIREALGVTDEN